MISPDNIAVRCLNVDSRARQSGLSEDFAFELLEAVEKPRGCVCWVTDVSMPTTWGNVNPTCSKLFLKEARGATEVAQTLEIAEGQYNLTQFKDAIQAALTARPSTVLEGGSRTMLP